MEVVGDGTSPAVAAVRVAGGSVLGVLAVVDREAGGREKIEAEGIPVVALVSRTELGLL